jgi:C1A family cysteine protease
MRTFINFSFFLFIFIYICNVNSFDRIEKLDGFLEASTVDAFHNWTKEYNHFFKNTTDFFSKFQIWYNNDKFIQNINNQNLSYKLGHNQFSIYTFDEFIFQAGLNNSFNYNNNKLYSFTKKYELPQQHDWVDLGAVTDVKDQGKCGSCWAFSTTGALEGAYFVKNKQLVSFSEQELVDCENSKHGGSDLGCNGGDMDTAFSWIKSNKGLCSEKDYPYVSGSTHKANEQCNVCSVVNGSQILNWTDVPPKSDDALMYAIYQQPVSVGIDAASLFFQFYKSGVFTGMCGTKLDHGVLAVGFGTDNSTNMDYYLVKNSWGKTWGDNGYIKIAKGEKYNSGSGQCGILLSASYPIL